MTKNKTLAIILSIVFALVLVVALGQSVFRVGKIELVAHTTTNHLAALNENTVITDSKLNKGKSVFLLDRNAYIKNLEKQQPYIQMFSLEVVYPNTVKFHYAEREEFFAINLTGGSVAYLDGEFKVLKVVEGEFNTTQQNPILLKTTTNLNSEEVEAGDFLNKDSFFDYLNLKQAYNSIGYTVPQAKAMIKSAEVNQTQDGDILTLQTYLGVKIQIVNAGYYTSEKLNLAYAHLQKLTQEQCASGAVYVFKNSKNALESRYIV